jgi:hypothetical protein
MEFKTHWNFDNFFPDARAMRQAIDDHFNDSIASKLPFEKRAIWNYWYIPQAYTYLRTEATTIFPHLLLEKFVRHLQLFGARQFGLLPSMPYLSMYISGCGQIIHNDYKNGRLAFVYSLTRWAERRFHGGETLIYHTADEAKRSLMLAGAGPAWFSMIEPVFNRFAMFDDHLPHAVNPIQGTMDPADARFVLHGHFKEPGFITHIEGDLQYADLTPPFEELKNSARSMFKSHGLDGFITAELTVEPSGKVSSADITCAQLLKRHPDSKEPSLGLDDAKALLTASVWPEMDGRSRLVFALGGPDLLDADR